MSRLLTYRFVLGMLISAMVLTMSYSTVKCFLENSTSEVTMLSSDWEDNCDDEDGEQKENKTKEGLDDCLEFSFQNIVGFASQLSSLQRVLPLGKCALSAIHLEVQGPPPKV